MTIVYALLAFWLIILIHELGHFLVAKACGMKVHEFSIGMGPRLLKKQGKETLYSLKLLPIGGSVQLGEDEDSDDPRAFRNKPVWQRMLVIVAGAIMNLILGLIICIITVLVSSKIGTCTIGGFHDSPSSNSFLQANDEIIEINGLSIWSTSDISYALSNSIAQEKADGEYATYDFKVIRNGQVVELPEVTFKTEKSTDGKDHIYLDFYVNAAEKTIGTVVSTAVKTALSFGRIVILSLFDLIRGTYGLNEISGPIGVVQMVSTVASIDIRGFLSTVAIITINLGIFNLLPIPALDGARFVFLVIEAIRRKPIKPEHEGIIHFVGFAALMLLMLVVTFNDIVRLVTGG